ncbi:MAG: hypothetical protein DDT21_02261 [Syntrophomonadaceae bacterium]|nr:hypothetical protein [Bacillota bacterium]
MVKLKRVLAALLLVLLPVALNDPGKDAVSGYLRLHVRANSDLPADQELKNAVRDTVLHALVPSLEQAGSAAEAAVIVDESLDEVVWRAEAAVRRAGFAYPVRVRMGATDFPTCMYGERVFNAGRYQALTIELGAGRGQNWWCVLFPPLCFVELQTAKDLADLSETASAVQPRSRLLEWWRRRTASQQELQKNPVSDIINSAKCLNSKENVSR